MPIKKSSGQKFQIKIRYFLIALTLIISASGPRMVVKAESCPDVRIVFARGSGGERWTTSDYLEFKGTIEEKLKTTSLSYEFIDLDYPAVGIGLDKIGVAIGAYFGSGEAYEFGESVNKGVENLTKLVNNSSCKNTKYVLGGYSQGAMTVSKALGSLNAEKIIYAATFGDPKLYLPEGEGLIPAACKGENLSDYRMYVPDCQAYKGLLGAYIPYEPMVFTGKVGMWCNKSDIICSSHFSISDHMSYIADSLYEDASKVIFDKISKAYEIENHISSPHDTAILIDSTGSMWGMIEQYKAEAMRLAEETLNAGGRVALYDYRDLDDPYEPVEHCNFETCTLETFQAGLSEIVIDGGGDTPESLLSASFHVMTNLEWKHGSTKSLVVLTDADFLSPDRDGMSYDEVVRMSKIIDPVNFYIITESEYGDYYNDLAEATGGKVVTDFNELSLLTDYIMERYDSLPRVEETDELLTRPTLEIKEVKEGRNGEITIKFTNNGSRTLVMLNEVILGMAEDDMITIDGLNRKVENTILLIPINDDIKGEAVKTVVRARDLGDEIYENGVQNNIFIPKAPNTGKQ